ncbi:MAG: isochorismatase family protein [Candidatus Hydrogenedentota bacterium]
MLNRDEAILVVIDFQESLMKKIPVAESITREALRLIRFATILELPMLWTEQYPKGLGPTRPDIAAEMEGVPVIEKTAFGCMHDSGFTESLEATRRNQLLITGVETHVCVMQTALQAAERGSEVFVVSDAVAAREKRQHEAGLERIKNSLCQLVTAEMAMFELLEISGTAEFKKCLPLLKG